MATANIAEVLKFAAKPVQYDNDEKAWLEFRFKLENYLTLVDEKYVARLQDAESQPVANLPTGTDEQAVTIRTLSHTLYALLATLTKECRTETGSKRGDSWWPRTRRKPRVGDSRCCKPCYTVTQSKQNLHSNEFLENDFGANQM